MCQVRILSLLILPCYMTEWRTSLAMYTHYCQLSSFSFDTALQPTACIPQVPLLKWLKRDSLSKEIFCSLLMAIQDLWYNLATWRSPEASTLWTVSKAGARLTPYFLLSLIINRRLGACWPQCGSLDNPWRRSSRPARCQPLLRKYPTWKRPFSCGNLAKRRLPCHKPSPRWGLSCPASRSTQVSAASGSAWVPPASRSAQLPSFTCFPRVSTHLQWSLPATIGPHLLPGPSWTRLNSLALSWTPALHSGSCSPVGANLIRPLLCSHHQSHLPLLWNSLDSGVLDSITDTWLCDALWPRGGGSEVDLDMDLQEDLD